jgi:hypothetical protein
MKDYFDAIAEYAISYATLERLQRGAGALMPVGDQKTGVIAEFYARIFAETEFPDSTLVYGTPSEHAWDITVRRSDQDDHKIQVKAVSAHSQTSRVSPIHPGWQEVYLIRLNDEFWPIGFWTLQASSVSWSTSKLNASTMPGNGKSGSAVFSDAVDRLEDMEARLNAAKG